MFLVWLDTDTEETSGRRQVKGGCRESHLGNPPPPRGLERPGPAAVLGVEYRTSNRVLSFDVDRVAKKTLIFCNLVKGHSIEMEIEVGSSP